MPWIITRLREVLAQTRFFGKTRGLAVVAVSLL